ncbi:hypothetical protein LCGC14_0336160 [marine sediment metagenome]|uniref:Uncharacterized protein n=1 Tax=marine sediment metagenome TaxID=412755 RepID=A0A0F9W279_9ZZZZ
MGTSPHVRIWRRRLVLSHCPLMLLSRIVTRERFGFFVKSFKVSPRYNGKYCFEFTVEKRDRRLVITDWDAKKARWVTGWFHPYGKLRWRDVARVLWMVWKSKSNPRIIVCEKPDVSGRPEKTFIVRGDGTITDIEVLSHDKIPKLDEPLTDSISSLRCHIKTATINPSDPCQWTVVCKYRAVDNEEPPCP